MLPSKQALTNLIGSLYEAAAQSTSWELFLGELAKTCQAESAAMVMHHFGREAHTVSASWNLDPDSERLYQKHYGSVDVWTIRAKSKLVGPACTSDWLYPLDELANTEFYNDFLIRFDIVHAMFGLAERKENSWASVGLYRGALAHEFRMSDLGTLNLLIPHIQRAFKLHFQISELKEHNEGMETALNMLATGIVFLGSRGEVVLVNTQAEEILSRADGLLLRLGRLSAAVQTESALLQNAIRGAVATGNGKGLSAGGTILISREKGHSFSITVAPLRQYSTTLSRRPAAVLFISDPDRTQELPADLLQRRYGLTPAEGRLAIALLEGHSLKEAADSSGVTYNTVKSQLKIIFLKTNVQRQGELIRLLLNTAGVMRPRSEAS